MERGPVWRVLLALSLLDMSSGAPGGSEGPGASGWVYEVNMEQVSFDKAVEGCSGGGGLAELPSQQEVSEVLLRLEDKLRGAADAQSFWVGLRRTRGQCVIPHLPLRGFSWRSDGGHHWAGPERWWEEPEQTCIVRCAALKAQANGTGLGRWGLLSRPCRGPHAFICQRARRHADPPLTSPVGTEPAPARTATASSTPTPTTHSTSILTPTTRPGPGPGPDTKPEPTPKPEAEPRPPPGAEQDPKPESKPHQPGPGPPPATVPGTKPCPMPNLPWARSLRPEPGDPGLLTLECWSGAQPQVHCSDGRWEYLGSPLDPAVVCPVSRSTAPPPPPPPPPPPSPSEAGQVEVQEGGWAGLMVPVLVAVALLVLLVVLVAVAVWCCLVRRSKDRAVRKAEKMAMENKEAGGKDSMETTNEKERR
ncbi:C-type lectin domain family 14 member A [Gadus macrocephalus]|uniref:C-type lectin domain family 14 member A n=1 Tax=Gadus macrocephalus TaxID=80720 RepID=UPI0028CB7808|nr:C-type lectin domain family 14 member A [Gadus macrocephalus]XP_059907554.1 C-type lectin domain family 14 member A [Gadus macrocephalus]